MSDDQRPPQDPRSVDYGPDKSPMHDPDDACVIEDPADLFDPDLPLADWRAMEEIAQILNVPEWDGGTIELVAEVVRKAGFNIDE